MEGKTVKTVNIKARSRSLAQLKDFWRRFRKNKIAVVGLAILVLYLLILIFADLIVPYSSAIKQDYNALMQGPSSTHIFGTDQLGRDLFARVIHGTRYSLSIGVFTTLTALFIGGILGSVAAFYGGKVDNIIMRIMDVFMCIPAILMALAIVAALGPSMINLMIALTITYVPGIIRLVRSAILSVIGSDYIEAARAYGCRDSRIIFRHVVPNAMAVVIVAASMDIARMILTATALSFIGMGIQPPTPEWGSILSDAKQYIRQAPYMTIFPGIAIILSVLAFNLIGDGLRDALDPRLKD